MSDRRIVFTCSTPNDQGGIITNDVLDFSRFSKNPVVLKNHEWDSLPVGLWTDWKEDANGYFSAVPVFHGLTEDSKELKRLYEGGWLRAASIGGEALWKQNQTGQYDLSSDGLMQCEKFVLYEISLVTLPSNPDAVQDEPVKLYSKKDVLNLVPSINTLSSKINKMSKKEPVNPELENEQTVDHAAALADAERKLAEAQKEVETAKKAKLAAKENEPGLPSWLEKIIGRSVLESAGFHKKVNLAPAPKDEPEESHPGKGDEPNTVDQPTPTGLAAEMEACREAAESAVAEAAACKEAAEKEGASAAEKEKYETAMQNANAAMSKYKEAKEKYESSKAEEAEEVEKKEKKSAQPVKAAAPVKPQRKTMKELQEEMVKLAPKPDISQAARVVAMSQGVTFSKLRSKFQNEKEKDSEEAKIMSRVMSSDFSGEKSISDYAIVLNSIINDQRFKAFTEKTRVMMNTPEASLPQYRRTPETRVGVSLTELAAGLNQGRVEVWDRFSNAMKSVTKLNSTDNALASPALTTIEWLPLAIFQLFPATSWKSLIPVFSAQITGANTGIIWANIAATPTVVRGNQPSGESDYTYTDTAVALSLTPYWLEPIRWTPLTMHQLRYDQMGTGWAQAFAYWGAVMDDFLLYTLASTVPASSVVYSSGLSGYQTTPLSFNIANSSSPDAFYWGTFTGTLTSPALNDITRIEQIYRKQNFMLEKEKAVLVTDPTMQAKLDSDPETKSLLTRWISSDGGDFEAFKHTIFAERSRVALVDSAANYLVKDPTGALAATVISAGVGFIPSQVGIGLGMLDVFMVQDPSNWGYKMSADIRIGIAPLRANYNGTTLFTYGPAPTSPSNV